jgi:ligand-binding sensor domain-containing protein
MRRLRWRYWLMAVIICSCFARTANTLDPSRSLSQYVHNVWSADKGFLGGTVYAICQSQDGYLWFERSEGWFASMALTSN